MERNVDEVRRWTALLAGALLALSLGACETIKGAGRDIEAAGEAIDDAIDDE